MTMYPSPSASVPPPPWKPASTSGNRWTCPSQPRYGDDITLHALEPHVVSGITFTRAVAAGLLNDGRDDKAIARSLGMSPGYFSKWSRAGAEEQASRFARFMRTTRSIAPLQKLADELGFELLAKRSIN